MRIVIVGAGAVGRHLSEQLSVEGQDVVLIDRDAEHLRKVERDLNILAVEGNGASAHVLEQAGIEKADLFIAVTDIDEVNLIACILAREYGVVRKVARVRNQEYLSVSSPINEQRLGIDLMINPDQVMADEIVRISEISEAFEAVQLAHGDVILVGYEIREDNPVCGITLADLRDLRGLYDFVVVAIVRRDETVIPRGGDSIRPGDRMYLVVRRRDVPAVEDLLNVRSRAVRKVFVVGGGQVGYRVARAMEERDVDVYLLETDVHRCEHLAEHLENAVVLNVDGLDSHDLMEEGVESADLVVAVTEEDTTNILASLLAKHLGAKKCITRISRPDFIPLLGRLGIDVALSSRLVAANMILRFVRRGAILSAATLVGSEAEVIEFVISSRWAYRDKALSDIPFPKEANVGAIVRKGKIIIPSGNSVIKPEDRLIVFSMKRAAAGLEQLLAS